MLAMSSPPLFSTIRWPFEEVISHNQDQNSYLCKDSCEVQLFHHQSILSQKKVEEFENYSSPLPGTSSSDHTMVKKLVHNASERDRRKKINTLFSSLRSFLPVADQRKKLSIPATISRVLKYIPELQQHVEGLTTRKEEILLRFSQQSDEVVISKKSQKNNQQPCYNSDFLVSTSRLTDSEVAIQISCYTAHKIPLSKILLCLENDGFVLLNVSSSQTFGGRVFYNLHFQVDKTLRLESKIINEKLLSIIEKEEKFL